MLVFKNWKIKMQPCSLSGICTSRVFTSLAGFILNVNVNRETTNMKTSHGSEHGSSIDWSSESFHINKNQVLKYHPLLFVAQQQSKPKTNNQK